ncbi:hypothetical protein CAEBREN_04726 [Caenorhabditis brenneri]|uniref:Uncharacterized protein n=1 Tax=Caenorhabditis brenneri TaxID=135651 RepID=G0PGK5_CAEBE|nr:hypothetical protein CAEBREN_04726 [Caenorhabditis brenneri]
MGMMVKDNQLLAYNNSEKVSLGTHKTSPFKTEGTSLLELMKAYSKKFGCDRIFPIDELLMILAFLIFQVANYQLKVSSWATGFDRLEMTSNVPWTGYQRIGNRSSKEKNKKKDAHT